MALVGVLGPSVTDKAPLPQPASAHQGVNPAKSAGRVAMAIACISILLLSVLNTLSRTDPMYKSSILLVYTQFIGLQCGSTT